MMRCQNYKDDHDGRYVTYGLPACRESVEFWVAIVMNEEQKYKRPNACSFPTSLLSFIHGDLYDVNVYCPQSIISPPSTSLSQHTL